MVTPAPEQRGDFVPVFGSHTAEKRAAAAAASAGALPLVLELVAGTTSIVHVGCAGGEWLVEAQRRGIADVTGIEGPWEEFDALALDSSLIATIDYTRPFTIER